MKKNVPWYQIEVRKFDRAYKSYKHRLPSSTLSTSNSFYPIGVHSNQENLFAPGLVTKQTFPDDKFDFSSFVKSFYPNKEVWATKEHMGGGE